MTPDILKNALNESFLSLQDINLIIFDECHHTIGGHPYNQIMRFYFSAMIEDRPKIFGMTASPSNSSLDADIAIRYE
jgi:endoribonuclease Dicer